MIEVTAITTTVTKETEAVLKKLREARMKRAAELLASTRLSVAEIAEQVGYLNQSKFASVFKKEFELSPLEYRRVRHLKEK